jgi:hypothetical protein
LTPILCTANSTRMHVSFAKALFALSILANLVIGLPVQALAHQWPSDHAVADQAANDRALQHNVAALEELCKVNHQQLPSADGEDCSCQAGLGSATLSDGGMGIVLELLLRPKQSWAATDQLVTASAFLPPLRPPRG